VEPLSLDEAYQDISGCRRYFQTVGIADGQAWPLQVAEHLKRTIKWETALDVSIGAGANCLIAKVACACAKPSGILYIQPGYEEPFLAPLPLKDLPGIGPRTAERLNRCNLRRARDLAGIPKSALAVRFGLFGIELAALARGHDLTPVSAGCKEAKSISRETTFETNLTRRQAIQAMLHYLLGRCGRELRQIQRLARTVTVKLRYANFQTFLRSRSLPAPSDHDDDFWPVAAHLLEKLHTRRVGVRLVGVALSNFTPARSAPFHIGRQMDLFDEGRYRRRTRFYRAVDRIRDRFGFGAVVLGQAIELLRTHEKNTHGFRLRTACLSR